MLLMDLYFVLLVLDLNLYILVQTSRKWSKDLCFKWPLGDSFLSEKMKHLSILWFKDIKNVNFKQSITKKDFFTSGVNMG